MGVVSQIAFLSLKEKQVKFQSYSGTITSETLWLLGWLITLLVLMDKLM